MSKSKCTKRFSFGALLEVEMSKKCTPLWREAHFEVKMYKAHQLRTTRKSARRCGAKHISKSKCTEHFSLGALLEVKMFKIVYSVVSRSTFSKSKCTKHQMFAPLLDVEASFRAAGARDSPPCQNEQNVRVLWHFQKRWQAWDI